MSVMKKNNLLLFLAGAFSMTQIRIVGNIGISELIVSLAAPWVFVVDYKLLRKDGFLTVSILSLLTCLSCCLSSLVNHTSSYDFLRGLATPYTIFAWIVVFHRMLRDDFKGYRYLFVGLAITYFLNIYAFQTGKDDSGVINGVSGDVEEAVIGNALFWITRIGSIVKLPIQAWYLETPLIYSIVVPVLLAFYSLFSTASGRSTAMGVVGASFLIAWGRKSKVSIKSIQRHFIAFFMIALIVANGAKKIYQYCASTGILGEQAQSKYEKQTRGGTDVLSLLMGGRGEFFIGFLAALDRPLLGFGPWALDTNGYVEDFLVKYGAQEDYADYLRFQLNAAKDGRMVRARWIPTHSHIVGYWVWYGVVGLFFWLYVFWLFWTLFRRYISAIPQLFGYFALGVPVACWNIFFSPVAHRCETALIVVLALFARAVQNRCWSLPLEMEDEIKCHDA